MPRGSIAIDMTGRRYGRLLVLMRGDNRGVKPTWICRCDCGTEKPVSGEDLRSRDAVSCGCWRREKTIAASTTHGRTGSRSFITWVGIRQRCHNPENHAFGNYGGRGITVCGRWRESFANFLADMGERPRGMSIDRINNNGNYEPGNCRWATDTEQARNRRGLRMVEFDGVTLPLKPMCQRLGLNYGAISQRVNKLGWDPIKALTTPLQVQVRR